jgi:hypothetical protein
MGEKNPYIGLDKKVVNSIMKKFICTKADDPEELKWYKLEDGLDYFATTLGSAVGIFFQNKHDKRSPGVKFVKPLAKGETEETDQIYHIETIKDGKKKIKRKTDKVLDFPDVRELFENDLSGYESIEITDIEKWIAVHDVMTKTKTLNGLYGTAKMTIRDNEVVVTLHDNEVDLNWRYPVESDIEFDPYFYDFELMLGIWKSVKDLKLKSITILVKNNESPIFFVGYDVEYKYHFAINRKLVR